MDTKQQEEFVQVVVRCRPISNAEQEAGSKNVVEIYQENNSLTVEDFNNFKSKFQFDTIYDLMSTQEQIYRNSAHPIIESVIEGFNGTIFAYGQTNSGKTQTLIGNLDDNKLKGIIPRSIDHIFFRIENLQNQNQNQKFTIFASFYELFSEKIKDLLSNSKANLTIVEDLANQGYIIEGLKRQKVQNASELYDLFSNGYNNQRTEPTNLSQPSTRNYLIFEINVENLNSNNVTKKIGILKFIKFSGSERLKQYQGSSYPVQLTQSISVFNSVVSSLINERLKEIPYKESILTQIIKSSLGGNSKTLMISTISPSHTCSEETINTLRVAQKVQKVKNKVYIQEYPKHSLKNQNKEIVEDINYQFK